MTKLRTFKNYKVMAQIKSEAAYKAILKRIDALLPLTGDDVPRTDPNVIELEALTDLVVEYEAIHYPVKSPSLIDIIRLRMYEMGLNQKNIAEMLLASGDFNHYESGRKSQ